MADVDKSKLFLLKSKLRATLPFTASVSRASDSYISSKPQPDLIRGKSVPSPIVGIPSDNSSTKQRSYDTEEAPFGQESLRACTDCGRKFNAESFGKHKRICRKVFKSKRKVFDSAKIRLSALEEYLPASVPSLTVKKKQRQMAEANASGLKTNWREKSAQFRSAIGSMRKENGGSHTMLNEDAGFSSRRDSRMTYCPHCDRGFNEDAAKRHIAVCQKLFGTKPGGGRLLRGAGTLSHSTMKRSDYNSSTALSSVFGRVSERRIR